MDHECGGDTVALLSRSRGEAFVLDVQFPAAPASMSKGKESAVYDGVDRG
jgi:hypothetical protein